MKKELVNEHFADLFCQCKLKYEKSDILSGHKPICRCPTYKVLVGGSSSGKSWTVAHYFFDLLLQNPGTILFCFQKVAADLNDATIQQFFDIIDEYDFEKYIQQYNKNERKIILTNGSRIHFRGLDNATRLKGSNFHVAWCEEFDSMTVEDLMMIVNRMRKSTVGMTYFNRHVVCTSNPTNDAKWLLEYLKDNELEHLYNHSTALDNPFLDPVIYQNLLNSSKTNAWHRSVYLLGEFANKVIDGLYYQSFCYEDRTTLTVDGNRTFYLSFDFNVMPCNSLLIGQMNDDNNLDIVDEITTVSPNNMLVDTLNKFYHKYKDALSKPGALIKFTGDASGKALSGLTHKNAYDIIEDYFREKNIKFQNYVPKSNPPHDQRRIFINDWAFIQKNVTISKYCKNLVEDLQNVTVLPDGGKAKPKTRNDNNQIYEKYGHMSDCCDYLIVAFKRADFENYFKKQKMKPAYFEVPNRFTFQ